jgi:curli biogenesis system outer membrane secretion channel CsgG
MFRLAEDSVVHGGGHCALRVAWWLAHAVLLIALAWAVAAQAAEWGFKIRDTVEDTGAEVVKVVPDSLAGQAGLRPGDVIFAAAGRRVSRAADVYEAIGKAPGGDEAVVLHVTRHGVEQQIRMQPAGVAAKPKPARSAWADDSDRSWTAQIYGGGGDAPVREAAREEKARDEAESAPPAPAAPPLPPLQPGEQRPRAMVMVGDLQAKAANASSAIGDGLREMLITALHNNGRFIVVERMDLQTLAAEQALSRSRMATPGMAIPEARMDIAEVMIVGAVTEFEPEAGGTGINLGFTKLPFSFGRKSTNAHMAIDVRVVDIASGRVLGSKRIKGKATASQTNVGISPKVSGGRIPVSLGSFQNTPMEEAIRGCIEQSIDFIVASVPQQYYRLQ